MVYQVYLLEISDGYYTEQYFIPANNPDEIVEWIRFHFNKRLSIPVNINNDLMEELIKNKSKMITPVNHMYSDEKLIVLFKSVSI